MATPILQVDGLAVRFKTQNQSYDVLRGVSFDLSEGETLALVGESGCGKSVTALAIMRLIATPPGEIFGGQVRFRGADLLKLPMAEMRAMRGRHISMVFQEPMSSLNPVRTVGEQIVEAIRLHQPLSPGDAKAEALRMLELVRIPSPKLRLDSYPHEMSGGMRQRVMIAIALSCRPEILIADEPTTALDVTIQAQIIDLLRDLRDQTGTAIILVTHDLGVVADFADRIAVMYSGRIVETSSVQDLFSDPHHPYTIGLLGSLPSLARERTRMEMVEGSVPNPGAMPPGCAFHPRCPFVVDRCSLEVPALAQVTPTQRAACWRAPL